MLETIYIFAVVEIFKKGIHILFIEKLKKWVLQIPISSTKYIIKIIQRR